MKTLDTNTVGGGGGSKSASSNQADNQRMATICEKFPEILITGVSGRYPASASVDELADNLYAGRDMVTRNADRWPIGKSL